jgi:hypothetical protein
MKKTKAPIALRLTLHATLTRVGICVAALIAGCATPPPPPAPVVVVPPPVAPPVAPPVVVAPPAFTGKVSNAQTPREYRRDAAAHLYEKNAGRIFAGKMPPLLYAVGVLQVDIDERGNVTKVSWMRAPTQAPEVMADVERSVRAAAPFPAPIKMGRVTYTDTWLWHKSGRFQLDTLTEGQL